MNDLEFTNRIEYIISMLNEKGYNPYEQLACYVLLQGNQYFITRHGDARTLIEQLDINEIKNYLIRNGVKLE
ncbi:MAG: IreB family regulatory phosphoprotein [Clostridia bacterium]|nr:IreB family regulatory phosphoprotein [Clostridia bacterium]